MKEIYNCGVLVFILLYTAQGICSNADFHNNKVLSTITFGSCNHHDDVQPLWSKIIDQNPDLWIWLGDAVYADTRILPFIWVPSSLENMKDKYDQQKENYEYKALLDRGTPVIGVWDDHDYGIDGGGKGFKYRFQSQKIFLDFVDEPIDSIRRTRKGIYASYSYGTGNQIVKIILLDVRSHMVTGSSCDILGDEQWEWLENQLNDDAPEIIFIGTGKQVLSDIPFIDKWMSCASSLDRLIFLAQKRSKVLFLSGDVHFSEVNCLNSSGTGYPLYEITSSGLTHSCSASLLPSGVCDWTLKNVVASRYRVSNVVTDKNFGVIKIDWESKPIKVTFNLVGENSILSTFKIVTDDLTLTRHPSSCPVAIEQPNWYWKRLFWCSVVLTVVLLCLLVLKILDVIGRWIALELLKDLDMKIKRRIKKLRLMVGAVYKKKNKEKSN